MAAPLIAIVGSVDTARVGELKLRAPESAEGAAEALGRELAVTGFRISVYTSDPKFIEAHVVRGYVGSGKAAAGSIEVRFPDGSEAATSRSTRPTPPPSASSPIPARTGRSRSTVPSTTSTVS